MLNDMIVTICKPVILTERGMDREDKKSISHAVVGTSIDSTSGDSLPILKAPNRLHTLHNQSLQTLESTLVDDNFDKSPT